MAWNLKQKAQDHIVSIGLGLIVLLLLVVWRAVPSSAWDRVSEATPKRALWALLGLAGIAICLLSGALIDNWRKKAAPKTEYLKIHGLYWDKALNPLCPADETLLFVSDQTLAMSGAIYDILKCPKCGNEISLRIDSHGLVTLSSMKNNIKAMIRLGLISD
jgi:hypothetical protein